MIKYRADIDGLRAIAVIPIVLYHAGYDWISGGFIGVDIFFVISGYLISSIILDEISRERFSFIKFYERRIRRILPALLVMLLATMLAAYFFLLPEEYTTLAQSTLAVAAFSPNIYFWLTSSTYFGLDIVTTPLLHTWSLGVEEQFYIIFPAILYGLISRCQRKTCISMILVLLALSLIANILVVEVAANSKFAFYMLPTRAWELLTGVVLSLGVLPKINQSLIANLIALIGAAMIMFAMLTLDEHSVFPGINAIYPVLGTALIIYSSTSQNTAVSNILGSRGFVSIGLISYSLYLWHWPVTVYTNMYWESNLNKPFIVAVSFALAYLSYRFIEMRFRKRSKVLISRGRLEEIAAATVLVSLISVFIFSSHGLPDRIPVDAWKAMSTNEQRVGKQHCKQFKNNELEASICAIGSNHTTPDFVLWGDSHAEAIANALHLAASKQGKSGVLIKSHGCRPLLGVYRRGNHRCQTFNNEVAKYIRSQPSLKHIFLAGYWRIPFTGQGYNNSNFLIVDEHTIIRSLDENRKVFKRGMERTLRELKDFTPVIIQDIPEIGSQFGKSVANHFIRDTWLGNSAKKELMFATKNQSFDQEFDEMVASYAPHPQYIKVQSVLCSNGSCPLLSNGKLVYSDGDHLSEYGASLLAPMFVNYFTKITLARN